MIFSDKHRKDKKPKSQSVSRNNFKVRIKQRFPWIKIPRSDTSEDKDKK